MKENMLRIILILIAAASVLVAALLKGAEPKVLNESFENNQNP